MEENEHKERERMCEVSGKTPTGPVWPTEPHWLSACQTNCFGWQRAVKTAWNRTWEWRNSFSLLPLGPVQHIWHCSMGIMEWSWLFTGPSWRLPWTLWSYSSPLVPAYSRDNFTATYQLLNCLWDASVSASSSINSPQVVSSFVHPPLKPLALPLEEGWKKSSDFFLHSHPWCSRGQRDVGSHNTRIKIWDVWAEGKSTALFSNSYKWVCVEITAARCQIEGLLSSCCSRLVLKTNNSHYYLAIVLAAEMSIAVADWRGLIRLNGAAQGKHPMQSKVNLVHPENGSPCLVLVLKNSTS